LTASPSEGEAPESPEAASPARIDALVRLLGDEDRKITAVAWDHLERLGDAALPVVERAAREADDARVRAQAARFLKEWSRREVFRQWVTFCRQDRLDLEQGAFLIARTEYPTLDVAAHRQTLDRYSNVLRGRLRGARTTEDAVKKTAHFLFQDMGFRGNQEEYYNPENSYLHRVLELKRGIPISLAVVFLLVARRLSIPVHGVSLPQHFLLKFREPGREVFVDAFHGGTLLSARDCARFLKDAGIPFREDYLRAVPDREILRRMLGNLLRIYMAAEDVRRMHRVGAMLKLLA
jgi:regulator of sirC expression with transglutaminase-like and TPR domain